MSTGSNDLMALADKLVKLGIMKGADEIEVSIGDGSQFRAGIRDGALETLTESGSRQLGIRAFVDGRTANASSSDLSLETLDRLVTNAVARARLGGKDEFAGLPQLEKVAVDANGLGIFDPAILALTPEEKIAYATRAEAIGLKQAGVTKSLGASFVSADETTILANSKGFRGSYRSTIAYTTVGFQAGEGDNLFQDGWFEGGPMRSALPEPEVLATTAARRVTRLIGARKVETQKVPVVVEPPVTAGLLDFLAEAVSGEAISRRQSFLVDKLGATIAAGTITIVDDGLLKNGFGTAPFDSEGVPRRTTTLVEAGVLKSYLLDTYYGRKLGMKSTGNAGGTTNLYLAAGTTKPEAIMASVERGLLLTGTIGFGTDPTTGDISIGAFGLWIEGGVATFPVAGITIAGNLGDLLRGVELIGNDLRFHGSTNGPTIKLAEMTIGGTTAAGRGSGG
jgi:PmbA protein